MQSVVSDFILLISWENMIQN